MISVDLMSLWKFVRSVLLCSSVRKKKTLESRGEIFLSQSAQSSLSLLAHISSPQKAFGIQRTQSVSASVGCKVLWIRLTWCLCEALCVLFICVFLWEIERTHSMRYGLWDSLGSFFSHRTHRFNRTFWRTVSNSQKASGIQNSQNVIAKGGCWLMSGRCWWLAKEGCWVIHVGCKVLWNRLT